MEPPLAIAPVPRSGASVSFQRAPLSVSFSKSITAMPK